MKCPFWIPLLLLSSFAWTSEKKNWEEEIYKALDQGKSKQALDLLEGWKATHGESDPQYWVAGANIWQQLGTTPTVEVTALPPGEYKADLEKNKGLVISDPDSGKPVGTIADGRPTFDPEKIKKAISFLDEGIRRNPYRLDIFVGRAHLYRTMDDLDGELAALDHLVKDPKPKNGMYETRAGHQLKGKLEEFQLEMLTAYAREHLEAGNQKALQAVAELIMRSFPKQPHGYNIVGVLARIRNDYPEAIKWYLKALEQEPSDSLVLSNLAYCYLQMGDTKSAVLQFRRIVELQNDPELVKQAKEELGKLKME